MNCLYWAHELKIEQILGNLKMFNATLFLMVLDKIKLTQSNVEWHIINVFQVVY